MDKANEYPYGLSDEQIDDIIYSLSGTCMVMLSEYDYLKQDQINEIMANAGYERCWECKWWMETCELTDEECNAVSCESCGAHRNPYV